MRTDERKARPELETELAKLHVEMAKLRTELAELVRTTPDDVEARMAKLETAAAERLPL